MRFLLIALGLSLLAACAQPIQVASNDDNAGLMRFVEPVNGAAYSQGDLWYYTENAGVAIGGNSTMQPRK